MIALILAAGFSTRLYPLTLTFPKALLKVQGQPILSQALDQLVKNEEISEIILVTNDIYLPHFENYLAQNFLTQRVKLLSNGTREQENRLGAIGDLNLVIKKFNLNEDLLVLASDTLTSLKLADFIKEFKVRKSSLTAVYEYQDVEKIRNKLGCAVLGEQGQILEFVEKPANPPSHYACIPYYLYKKEDLALIKKYLEAGLSTDSPGSLLSFLVKKTPLFAFVVPPSGYYFDVGTKDTLTKLQEDAKIAL